jgi:large subunit ribosomal protein L21
MSDGENLTETGPGVAAYGGGEAARPAGKKNQPRPDTLAATLPPYAIIETGGKQYRVSVGDRLSVEKLPVAAGETITFDRVLLLGGDGDTRVGTPVVEGASVAATVEETYRGEKIVVFKYKPKKHYRRRNGHRQTLTRLNITAINA